ncbi:MAG: YitT family protein, partial [Clostridia bacterium]|nr:YitT family protein [Clostridia bacterium]
HRVFPPLKINYGIFLTDGIVVVASAFVFEPQAAMYALISIFISNVMIDLVLEGPNSANSYFIISDKSEDIARRIMDEMERGVTGLDGVGMFHGKEKRVLLCVVNRFESMRLRRIIFSVDPSAFVISNKAHEVLGEGFKPGN